MGQLGETKKQKNHMLWALDRLLPYFMLTALMAALMLLPISPGEMFGSEGDWYSQHVGAAEAIRKTMLQQETLFPQFAGIGGGINAYDLAYYGLLRPDILFSYFFPELPMRQIISSYALLGAIASVNLTFFWMRRRKLDRLPAICGSVLVAGAACFFHAHHQIVFVNYMPFLIAAFMGVDRLLEKRKSGVLTVSVFFICIHSFYYAPACLLVCLLYGLYQLGAGKSKEQQTIRWRNILYAVGAVILGVGLAAVLLLPAGLDILSTVKDAGRFGEESVGAIDLTLGSLLYQPYGCGMSLIVLYCLLLSLKRRETRLLAAALLAILILPQIWYVLSGFLYPREKVLIPLVPLLAWLCADTFQEIRCGRQRANLWAAALCLLPLLAIEGGDKKTMLLVDGAMILLFFLVQKAKGLSVGLKRKSFLLLLVVPLCVSFNVNRQEDYLAQDDSRQSRFAFSEIAAFAKEPGYRFDYLANNYINSNVLPAGNLNKTASYLSVTNAAYGDFYYNTMGNPISLRNRVVLMPGANSLFNYFMGIRYVLTEEERIPYGYEPVVSRNGFVLAENPDVLPICYGTDRPISEAHLSRMGFPEKMATLCGVSWQKENPKTFFAKDFPEGFEETSGASGRDYLPFTKPIRDRALILTFDIRRRDGREVNISVNGMKNTLSSSSAPYPNKNKRFTFVLAPENGDKTLEEVKLNFSKGDYHIENLQVFTAELPPVERAESRIWRTEPVQEHKGAAENFSFQKGSGVFSGKLNMKQDGWFVSTYPYKAGYRITVDGNPVSAERVNGVFLGFPLRKGSYEIQITYKAPGFSAGCCLSLISAGLLILNMIREHFRDRKRSKSC